MASELEADHHDAPPTASGGVGARANSKFGRAYVTGGGQYVDDVELPGMRHARFVRSPHAHAAILGIDTRSAEAMDGVHLVWTAAELAPRLHEPYGYALDDETVLAHDRVLFAGQPVAVVLAEDRRTATLAAERVEVEYDRLEPVTTPAAALADDAPLLHPDRDADPDCQTRGNVAFEGRVLAGDVDAAFEEADLVVEDTYRTNKTAPVPLEPHGYVADYNRGSGKLTLWSPTQFPHKTLQMLAELVRGLDSNDIVVRLPDVGGGFGNKVELYPAEICAVALSMATGRPVKHVQDRLEEFQAGRGRHDERLHGRLALTADGDLLGFDVDLEQNNGAFVSYGLPIAFSSCNCGAGPYEIPHQRWAYRGVYTNLMPASAVRGFGDYQVTFMREALLEQAAAELGIDAVELRLRNVPSIDEMPMRSATGLVFRNSDMPTCLRRVREAIDWEAHRGGTRTPSGKLRGVGMATVLKRNGNKSAHESDYDEVFVRISRRGDVTVHSGIAAIGQGTETGLAQLVADTLGVSIDRVEPVVSDTDATGESLGVWADRGAIIAGSAAARAAEDVKATLVSLAAHVLGADPVSIQLGGERAYVAGEPERGLDFEELAEMAMRADPEQIGPEEERPPALRGGISLIGTGKYESQEAEYIDPDTGYGNVAHSYTFGALAFVVDVDPTTGDIDVVDTAVCEDLGRVINPKLVEGQVQGGVVQALGEVLAEEFVYDDRGTLQNGNLLEYHLPTPPDVPLITKIDHLENPDPTTSHGQRGVGESPLVPVAGALANAVADATGIRFTELPLSPQRVLPALVEAGLREL